MIVPEQSMDWRMSVSGKVFELGRVRENVKSSPTNVVRIFFGRKIDH